MPVTYPSTLPCPMIEGYSIDVDAGLIRSKERGLPTQRRVYQTMPQSVKCKFTLSFRQWGHFQSFLANEATDWFWIDLPSMYAGLKSKRTFPHLVRLVSQIAIDTKSATHITASVTLEMAPSNFKQYLEAV